MKSTLQKYCPFLKIPYTNFLILSEFPTEHRFHYFFVNIVNISCIRSPESLSFLFVSPDWYLNSFWGTVLTVNSSTGLWWHILQWGPAFLNDTVTGLGLSAQGLLCCEQHPEESVPTDSAHGDWVWWHISRTKVKATKFWHCTFNYMNESLHLSFWNSRFKCFFIISR